MASKGLKKGLKAAGAAKKGVEKLLKPAELKVTIPAGKASGAPPLGPQLGQVKIVFYHTRLNMTPLSSLQSQTLVCFLVDVTLVYWSDTDTVTVLVVGLFVCSANEGYTFVMSYSTTIIWNIGTVSRC